MTFQPEPEIRRSDTDEAPVLAASILWKLSEYEDFVLPLLKADAAGVCAVAVEELGPPRAGPLQFWLQVLVQVFCLGTRVCFFCTNRVTYADILSGSKQIQLIR